MTTHQEPVVRLRRALEGLLGVPFTEGNHVDVLRNGARFFPALLDGISSSTRSIDMLWFLWGRGSPTEDVAAALAERAAAGVRVRLLLDAFGAHGMDRGLVDRLREGGAEVQFHHPVPGLRPRTANLRTHRRSLVVDECVALTGGLGLDQAWAGDATDPADWRDTGYRVAGPAVAGIRSAFARSWLQTSGPLLTDVDTFPALDRAGDAAVQVLTPESRPGWNSAALALEVLTELAEHRLRIATPYSRIPRRLLARLAAAAARGVRVQLMVPGPHVDKTVAHLQGEYDYEHLLGAGVEIWRYQPSMLHNKLVTVDGVVALVGTTNFDTRSLALNEQVAMVVADERTVRRLDGDYDRDLERSQRLDVEAWQGRARTRRMLQAAAYVAGYPLRGLGSLGLTSRYPTGVRRLHRRSVLER